MEGDLLTNNDEDADPERLDKAERLLKKGQRFYYGEGGRVDPVRLTSAYNMLGGLFMKKRDFYQALQMFDLAAEKARGFDLAVGKPEEAQSKNIHYEAAALVNRSAALLEIEMPQHLERTSALLNAVEEPTILASRPLHMEAVGSIELGLR